MTKAYDEKEKPDFKALIQLWVKDGNMGRTSDTRESYFRVVSHLHCLHDEDLDEIYEAMAEKLWPDGEHMDPHYSGPAASTLDMVKLNATRKRLHKDVPLTATLFDVGCFCGNHARDLAHGEGPETCVVCDVKRVQEQVGVATLAKDMAEAANERLMAVFKLLEDSVDIKSIMNDVLRKLGSVRGD